MLEIKNLTKTFGDFTAVDDLSFEIKDGEILGLIGQNGAGKTTTFRLILNFLNQDNGTVLWNGEPLSSKEYNIIGYLPEERGLYPKESIEKQLLFYSKSVFMSIRRCRRPAKWGVVKYYARYFA